MKKLFVSLCLILFLVSLASCSGGVSTKETAALSSETLQLIQNGNFRAAGENFHPAVAANAGQPIEVVLQTYVTQLYEQFGLDLSQEATDVKTTGFHVSFYTSEVKGSRCELNFSLKFGGKNAAMTTSVVRNDEGYGIYSLRITPAN